jgi:hypothetical protein
LLNIIILPQMDVDSMNNGATSGNQLTTEQQTIVDIQQRENSTCNQLNLEEIEIVISNKEDCSKAPTILYISFFSSQS